MRRKLGKKENGNKRLNSVNDDDEMTEQDDEEKMESIDECADEDDEWNYVYDELSLLSDDEDEDEDVEVRSADSSSSSSKSPSPRQSANSGVLLMRSRSVSQSVKLRRQPHIIYWEVDAANRENNAPRATISEVLNALDMPGAVKDIKRFNYVCRVNLSF